MTQEDLIKRIEACNKSLIDANTRKEAVAWMAEASTLLDLCVKTLKKNNCSRSNTLDEAALICDETYVEPGDLQVARCSEAAEKIRALKRLI